MENIKSQIIYLQIENSLDQMCNIIKRKQLPNKLYAYLLFTKYTNSKKLNDYN